MGKAFERVITLQLERFSPEEARRRHIAVARRGLAAFMARQAAKPGVVLEVDGHAATSEDEVKPFGVIVYRFTRIREIALFALAKAIEISPVLSGRYKKSWFVMVNHQQVPPDQIPEGVEVVITNDQPYARKIHVGAKGFKRYVPPGIVEKLRQMTIRKYGNLVDVEIQFVTLAGGYVIRGNMKTALAQLNRKSSVFRAGGTRLARRKDLLPGGEMTYPALVITPRRFV